MYHSVQLTGLNVFFVLISVENNLHVGINIIGYMKKFPCNRHVVFFPGG